MGAETCILSGPKIQIIGGSYGVSYLLYVMLWLLFKNAENVSWKAFGVTFYDLV